jgi:predicted AAA+ superfamily ATPase
VSGSRREELFRRLERLLEQAERLFGVSAEPALDGRALAYRWQDGALEPIHHPDLYPLDGLLGVERSVARLRTNAASFVRGEPALDALLYGERGTGKSSAVRGLLGELGTKGLRLVEVRPHELGALPRIFAALRGRPERYALFCDDLSFEEGDASFRDLKAVLDGGIEARPENVLILATSNRRHLIRELARDNLEARLDPQGELHPGETVEEKISLSDRFGLLLPFFAFDQETYLRIVDHHARELGLSGSLPQAEICAGALRFALERASRSGRTARQACVLMLQERSAEPT